jgi:hypothetical protein
MPESNVSDASLLAEKLENIWNLSGDELLSKFQGISPSQPLPGPDFMAKLST